MTPCEFIGCTLFNKVEGKLITNMPRQYASVKALV